MSESYLARQLGARVRAALAPAAEYLALVVQNNPRASGEAFASRPDVMAILADAMVEAREAAIAATDQAWAQAGAPPTFIYTRLLADVGRAYDLEQLRAQLLTAHASVPPEDFDPALHAPGEHPAARAAERRGAAVRGAVLAWARQAALRNQMTVSTAQGTGTATATLQDALDLAEEEPGTALRKRWRARPGCCLWCRRLHGVTIGLRESFASYLGGPAILHDGPYRRVATPAGERKFRAQTGSLIVYTQPPRLYHGDLQGPLLHPFCRCKLDILRAGEHRPAVSLSSGQEGFADDGPPPRKDPPARSLAASDIWGMPEDRYQALLALLRAGAAELGTVLSRLAEGSADRPDPAVLRGQHSVLRTGVHRIAGVRTPAPGERARVRVRAAGPGVHGGGGPVHLRPAPERAGQCAGRRRGAGRGRAGR